MLLLRGKEFCQAGGGEKAVVQAVQMTCLETGSQGDRAMREPRVRRRGNVTTRLVVEGGSDMAR